MRKFTELNQSVFDLLNINKDKQDIVKTAENLTKSKSKKIRKNQENQDLDISITEPEQKIINTPVIKRPKKNIDIKSGDNTNNENVIDNKIKKVSQPKSIGDTIIDSKLNDLKNENIKESSKSEKKNDIEKRKKDPDKSKELLEALPDAEYDVANDIIKDQIEDVNGIKIDDNVDAIEVDNIINKGDKVIPGGVNPKELDIKVRKDKERNDRGYYKAVVHIRPDIIPEEMNKLASYIKNQSKKSIVPRLTSTRVLTVVNSVQLRGQKEELKLTAKSLTFKPKHDQMFTRRGTRVIVSAPQDFDSKKELIVFLQEGRNHESVRIQSQKNHDINSYINYIGDRIIEFYENGMDATMAKLKLYMTTQPLMGVIESILGTYMYKIMPIIEKSTNTIRDIYVFDKVNKRNQNLYVTITEGNFHQYEINVVEKGGSNDQVFEQELLICDLGTLNDKIIGILKDTFEKDWSQELGTKNDIVKYHEKILGFLSFGVMRKAYKKILDIFKKDYALDKKDRVDIMIDDVITKRDFPKQPDTKNGIGESLIGHTDYCDFILSYMRITEYEGDKRDSKSFITGEKYHEFFPDVDYKTPYEKRKRAIGNKQKNEKGDPIGNRNYHTGFYGFKLDYTDKRFKKSNIYIDKDFDTVLKNTQFLSDKILFPKSPLGSALIPKSSYIKRK